MGLAQHSAELNPVLESLKHNTHCSLLCCLRYQKNAWSASLARRRSQLTLKQVRHRGTIKRLYVLKQLSCQRKNNTGLSLERKNE